MSIIDIDEVRAKKALDSLDKLSEEWATEVNLDAIIESLTTKQKIKDMLLLAFIEGAYRGAIGTSDYYKQKYNLAIKLKASISGKEAV